MARSESCVQPYVRELPSSVAVPARVTVAPSRTVWSVPASMDGGSLFSMVTITLSATVLGPSVTVSVNVTFVSDVTAGALKVAVRAAESDSVMARSESCVQPYVRELPSSVAVPARVTVAPSRTVWSVPASMTADRCSRW